MALFVAYGFVESVVSEAAVPVNQTTAMVIIICCFPCMLYAYDAMVACRRCVLLLHFLLFASIIHSHSSSCVT